MHLCWHSEDPSSIVLKWQAALDWWVFASILLFVACFFPDMFNRKKIHTRTFIIMWANPLQNSISVCLRNGSKNKQVHKHNSLYGNMRKIMPVPDHYSCSFVEERGDKESTTKNKKVINKPDLAKNILKSFLFIWYYFAISSLQFSFANSKGPQDWGFVAFDSLNIS